MLRFLFALIFLVSAAPVSVLADDGKPPKELVEKLSLSAHEAFVTIKNPEGQPIVKPEDAKNLKFPLVDFSEREMAVARGYLSSSAKWCGLKWEEDFFRPYVASLKKEHGKKWTPFQYAYAEILHGLSMAIAEKSKAGKTCSDAEKQKLAAIAKK